MTHTYASTKQLADYLRDNGATDLGSDLNDLWLSRLETASRAVDGFCDRGLSGFGPRTGTNRYRVGWYCSSLELDDDLVSPATSISRVNLDGTGTVALSSSGYYLEPLNRDQKRVVTLVTEDFGGAFVDIVGTWGFSNQTDTLVATLSGAISSTSATAVTVSGDPDIAAGQTLLCGTEQMYVRRAEGTVLTVDRGVNGTVAATHIDTSALAAYRYHPDVVEATLAIATRRMRMRDAGLVPDFGGQSAVVSPRDTERSLLRAIVGHLKVYGAA